MLLHVERHRQKAPSAVMFNALQRLKNSEGRFVRIKGESKGVLLEQEAQCWRRGLFVRLLSVSLWLFLNKIVRVIKVKYNRAAHRTVCRT